MKPYYVHDSEHDQPQAGQSEDQNQPQYDEDTIIVQDSEPNPEPTRRGRGRPRNQPSANLADITVFLQDEPNFQASRYKEVIGLLEKGTFEIATDIPQDACIFKAWFVDEIKNAGTDKAFEKSRLVVQAYNDDEKSLVLM